MTGKKEIYKLKPIKIKSKRVFALLPKLICNNFVWFKFYYKLIVTIRILIYDVVDYKLKFSYLTKEELDCELEKYDLTNYKRK